MKGESPLLGLQTILVVDDNVRAGQLVARTLAQSGLYVHVEVRGLDAVAWFAERAAQVHLVLLDQSMPGLSGVEVADRLWAIRADTPIFLMSALEDEAIAPILKGWPFLGFLKKPFRSWELHLRVQSVLGV